MRALFTCALVALLGCGPPSATDPITFFGTTITPLHSFAAITRVTDETACVEELVLVVTNQALTCDEYAAQTEGVFLLEGEDRVILRLNRGTIEERRGTYDVLGGFLDPPDRQ